MNIGDHLITPRTSYTHHGLYIGNGEVIHYSGFANGLSKGKIAITSLDQFSRGHGVSVKERFSRSYNGKESVKRARSRLGEDWYNVMLNNCEHFVNWCIDGTHSSEQVNSVVASVNSAYNVSTQRKPIPKTAQATIGGSTRTFGAPKTMPTIFPQTMPSPTSPASILVVTAILAWKLFGD